MRTAVTSQVFGFVYDSVHGTISSIGAAASANLGVSKLVFGALSSDYCQGWSDCLTACAVLYILYRAAKCSWKVTLVACMAALAVNILDVDPYEVLENAIAEIRARSAKGSGPKAPAVH